MKRALKSFFSLPRTERLGFSALSILLLLLMAGYAAMPYFVHPARDNSVVSQRFAASWEAYRKSQPQINGLAGPVISSATLFTFDPNTLDSAGFCRLGLSPKVIKGLMNWKRHGKHFYAAEDLKPLYNLSDEEYARIAPYISIAPSGDERQPFTRDGWTSKFAPIPTEIDINTTDTTTLDRAIKGVGPALARKIIARRNGLGGYLTFEQITDGLRLPDSTIAYLKEKVRIDPGKVRMLHINSATEDQLSTNPYIGEKIAKGIVQLRGGYGKYTSISQLRQAPLMTEEIYRRIAPYLVVD